jgi:alpha-D-xyloside xylohydrolase
MKFTDGYWLTKTGYTPHYAAQVYDFKAEEKELVLQVPTKVIRHRGDTLAGPLLDIRLSSPHEGIIKVSIQHYSGRGRPNPEFPLFCEDQPIDFTESKNELHLNAGSLQATIHHGDRWQIDFKNYDTILTSSTHKSVGYINGPEGKNYLHQQLSLDVGELVYGLGERFTAFVKNGQVVETWNEDGGTGSDQAYKTVPFYMTNRGYAVFVNEPGPVSFEVASEKVSRVQFSLEAESLEYFVIYGPTPAEILERYTALTGRPALPPAWSFGLWLTTSFTTNYDEKTVTEFVQGFRDRDIPLHTFHFDCFWMKGFHWCDFEWDQDVFPDPRGMLKRLHDQGLKICVWINPYIAQLSPLFAEAAENGYLIKRADGTPWQWDLWQPGMGIVDFTNPDACTWYSEKLTRLLEMGVDSFKTDFGERIPTDVVYYDGSDPVKAHNFYPYLYNKVVMETLERHRGKGDAVLFARSATAGCQQYPVHWGGDCYSDFPSMAESLRGGLSLSTCGFGFWSHDIGGFEGLPPADIYKRWAAFGLLSSHSRLHGSSSYRVPWLYDDEACDTVREFTRLKCRLMPYIYSQAVIAHTKGTPVMRPVFFEFPKDPGSHTIDRQYMLGSSLLVTPVLSSSGEVDVYLPAGTWTSWFTSEQRSGGSWHQESHGFLTASIWVKENTLLAVGANSEQPDYDYANGVEFRAYQIENTTASVPNLDGSESVKCKAVRHCNQLTFKLTGNSKTATILLVGINALESVTGCTQELTAEGIRLDPSQAEFTVTLT